MAESLTEFGLLTPAEFRNTPESALVLGRLLAAENPDEVDLQIKLETLATLVRIKRVLIWTLVIVPLLLGGASVVLYIAATRVP
ncbi:hypothetical protein [Amycolatopsis sp. NPDC058986]|uniref:hypothetical protein n=1 Tax=unclassified Amycolatopsis TaxID=2618356 RepID=UPI003671304F